MALETMTKLASTTVGVGGVASIAFTNIPQGYTDLKILLSVRSTGSYGGTDTMVDDILLTFNGSAAANYSSKRLSADGSTAYSTAFTSQTAMNRFYVDGSGATASTFGSTEIYITNYSGSTTKSLSAETVGEHNATKSYMNILAGVWNDSSAITSISFSLVNGNFAQHSTATLYGIKNARQTAGNSIKATGGNIVFDGTYVYHVFPTTGAFTPTQPILADVLVVAGGGAGGGQNAGGGGAGGLLEFNSQSLNSQAYTCTIGAGGTSVYNSSATNGSNSLFGGLTASVGGGSGGWFTGGASANAQPGGSGGGAGGVGGILKTGGAGTAGQGNNGGNCLVNDYAGAGGGGAGAVGTTVTLSERGGAGGIGATSALINSIGLNTGAGQLSGGVYYFAGGGGGAGNVAQGAGGLGGGGEGSGVANTGAGTAGRANTGGGGGGARGVSAGGAGGSGIIVVRYKG